MLLIGCVCSVYLAAVGSRRSTTREMYEVYRIAQWLLVFRRNDCLLSVSEREEGNKTVSKMLLVK